MLILYVSMFRFNHGRGINTLTTDDVNGHTYMQRKVQSGNKSMYVLYVFI